MTNETNTLDRPAVQPSTQGPARRRRITDEERDACHTAQATVKALAILGLIDAAGTTATCPECGRTLSIAEKEFRIWDDGGIKHYKTPGCGKPGGYAIDLLKDKLGLSYPDAVRALLGQPTTVPIPTVENLPELTVSSFKAVWDPQVLAGVLTYARKAFNGEGIRAAHEFYGQWHIPPEVVDAAGAVYITRPDHFAEMIVERFGMERLIACGLFVITKKGEPMSLVSKKWPVVEPGHDAAGNVTNLQFRASNAQYARYLRHKAGELDYQGNQKFVNLRGVPNELYLGCGLHQIAALTEPTTIYWVEGFKDRLAAMTMGLHAYGIPGVSYRPPTAVYEVMRPHNNVVSLDADEAGKIGLFGVREKQDDGSIKVVRPGLVDHMAEAGLKVAVHQPKEGLDITDSLVLKHAQAGCGCAECVKMRARFNL